MQFQAPAGQWRNRNEWEVAGSPFPVIYEGVQGQKSYDRNLFSLGKGWCISFSGNIHQSLTFIWHSLIRYSWTHSRSWALYLEWHDRHDGWEPFPQEACRLLMGKGQRCSVWGRSTRRVNTDAWDTQEGHLGVRTGASRKKKQSGPARCEIIEYLCIGVCPQFLVSSFWNFWYFLSDKSSRNNFYSRIWLLTLVPDSFGLSCVIMSFILMKWLLIRGEVDPGWSPERLSHDQPHHHPPGREEGLEIELMINQAYMMKW